MRKYILGLLFVVGLSMPSMAIDINMTDILAVGNDGSGGVLFRVNSEGEPVSSGGMINVRDVFNDLEALSVTKNMNFSISTATLVSATTSPVDITQPTNPMNLVAEVSFATGETTTTVVGTLLITGVDARGNAATETLNISTTQATGSISFASITSLAWTVTQVSGRENATIENALLQVGNGTKVGLSNDISAATDIIQVFYDDSGTSADDAGYTLSTTYDTIIFSTTNDGTTDVGTVVYKATSR